MPNIVDSEGTSKAMLVLKIVWIAMLIPLAIYLVIGHYLTETETISSSTSLPINTLRIVFYAISILIISSIKYIRKFIMSRPIKHKGPVQITNVSQHPVIKKYANAMIVSQLLAESVGMFGLVLAILGNSRVDLYLLLLISIAAMLYCMPKLEELSELLNYQQGTA